MRVVTNDSGLHFLRSAAAGLIATRPTRCKDAVRNVFVVLLRLVGCQALPSVAGDSLMGRGWPARCYMPFLLRPFFPWGSPCPSSIVVTASPSFLETIKTDEFTSHGMTGPALPVRANPQERAGICKTGSSLPLALWVRGLASMDYRELVSDVICRTKVI